MDQGHRRKERPLPPTGGGPPIISASGRIVNLAKPSAPTSYTLTLTVDARAEPVGREIVELTRVACHEDDFDAVSTLLVLFPDVVPRVAEFHALMDEHVDTLTRGGRSRRAGPIGHRTSSAPLAWTRPAQSLALDPGRRRPRRASELSR